jgi:uncharacterized membrane protein
MISVRPRYRSKPATAIFDLFNPIPHGLFVGTLIFDIVYATTYNVFWAKGAAWLVTAGLVLAIAPRLINLGHVWFSPRGTAAPVERLDFWLNLAAIMAAICNAFIHSRDGYGIVPLNVILSVITVGLLSVGHVAVAFDRFGAMETARE